MSTHLVAVTRRQETAKVKHALREAGLPVRRVVHGTGAAWCWLDITLGAKGWTYERMRQTVDIAQRVTGRSGDYDGKINVSREAG